METGITVPDGDTPLCMLDWSDDGANTWSNERFYKLGNIGQTSKRVYFKRLGSTKRTTGLDRIFRFSTLANCRIAIMGANINE